MRLSDLICAVFCLCDDYLLGRKLRQRGFAPKLHDSEVLTMEIVGEFLGLDTDTALYHYFRRHHAALFPALQEVHRTTFLRQAANLWAVKHRLWRHVLPQVQLDPLLSILDSAPVPVCRFSRAKRSRLFGALAAYGKDTLQLGTFFGFRVHLRVHWPGVITAFEIAPANSTDITVAPDLVEDTTGWILGDRAYWSEEWHRQEKEQGRIVLAPFQTKKHEKGRRWPFWLLLKRRRVETVLSQMVERFRAKRTWARDAWHLCNRWLRKVLAHTIAVLLCQQQRLGDLRFAQLLED